VACLVTAGSFVIDEVPHPMASELDHVHFEGRLDGLFRKRCIKEATHIDCTLDCEKADEKIVGLDGLAKVPTDVRGATFFLSSECWRRIPAG
jgi:hypothetical protein